jgi:serum/glucocorticoid-regulated kinase 2
MDAATQEMDPPFDPEIFDAVTVDFITRLLSKDPATRLGAGGSDEVIRHAYFGDINWEEIIHDRAEPPAIPRKDLNVATQHEIGSFMDSSKTKIELTQVDADMFNQWDFVRQSSFLEEVVEFMRFEEEKVF